MEGIQWTLELLSHVKMDTPDLVPALELVKLQEVGIVKLQNAIKVIHWQDFGLCLQKFLWFSDKSLLISVKYKKIITICCSEKEWKLIHYITSVPNNILLHREEILLSIYGKSETRKWEVSNNVQTTSRRQSGSR